MAGFSKIPHGKVVQLEGLFANMGEEVVDLLIREPKRVHDWIGGLSNELTLPPAAPELWFSTTKEVFDAFHGRCYRRGWRISGTDIFRLFGKYQELEDFQSTLNRALVPFVWLGSLELTIGELWLWVRDALGDDKTYRFNSLQFDSDHLRLLEGMDYGSQPFVRWVEIDMTANYGRAPRDVRDEHSAGVQLLSAAAVHPGWARAIDHISVTGVNLGGLQAAPPASLKKWQNVPYLTRDDIGELWLFTDGDGTASSGYSVPTFREL